MYSISGEAKSILSNRFRDGKFKARMTMPPMPVLFSNATFSRNSQAYNADGSVVGVNVPRFPLAKFNKGILIEEGTTNLMADPQNVQTLANMSGYGASTKMTNESIPYWRVISDPAKFISTYENPIMSYMMANCIVGQQYTISCDVRVPNAGDVGFFNNTGMNKNVPANVWTRIFYTFTYSTNLRVAGHSYSGVQLDYRNWQLEQKPYATSFIIGTRQPETLTIPTTGVPNANEGTVEIVINPLTIQNYNNFLWMPISTGRFLLFFTIQGAVLWDFGPVNSSLSTLWNYISAGSFYSFVLRWSAKAGTREMFINGVKIGSLPFTPPAQSSIPATFSLINNFSAIIDDLRISSIARSDAEIAANYASNQPLPVDQYTTAKLNFDGDLSNSPYVPTFDNNDIETIDLSDGIILDDNFEIGTATMATAKIKILNKNVAAGYNFEGKEAKAEIGVTLSNGNIEYIPLGYFTIEKGKCTNGFDTTLSTVDRMYKFETPYVCSLTFPATLLQVAQDICNEADVDFTNTSFVNSDYVIQNKPSFKDNLTCRKAIMAVAELAAGYARINRDGKLEIINANASANNAVNYASSNTYISSDNWIIADELIDGVIEISRDNYISMDNKELPINKIDSVIIGKSSRGSGDNPITIDQNNIFLQEPEKVIDNIYNSLNGFSYYPVNMTWQGNPAIDCGDKLTILGNNGSRFNTILTSRNLSFNGGLSEEYKAVGKSSTEENSTPVGDTDIKIEDTKNDMQQYIDDAISALAGNKGGYVYFRRNDDGSLSEIFVMNTPSPVTAKKCIRINQNGIGGSTNGINGPFNVSMLIDGTINANMVATGTMIADRIKGGTLTLGGLNNQNGSLIMVDANGNQIGIWDKDGIKILHSDGSYTKMDSSGIQRFVNGTGQNYHYLIKCDTVEAQTGNFTETVVQLPDDFKGKSFQVIVSLNTLTAKTNTPFPGDTALQDLRCGAYGYDYANARFTVYSAFIMTDGGTNAYTARFNYMVIA